MFTIRFWISVLLLTVFVVGRVPLTAAYPNKFSKVLLSTTGERVTFAQIETAQKTVGHIGGEGGRQAKNSSALLAVAIPVSLGEPTPVGEIIVVCLLLATAANGLKDVPCIHPNIAFVPPPPRKTEYPGRQAHFPAHEEYLPRLIGISGSAPSIPIIPVPGVPRRSIPNVPIIPFLLRNDASADSLSGSDSALRRMLDRVAATTEGQAASEAILTRAREEAAESLTGREQELLDHIIDMIGTERLSKYAEGTDIDAIIATELAISGLAPNERENVRNGIHRVKEIFDEAMSNTTFEHMMIIFRQTLERRAAETGMTVEEYFQDQMEIQEREDRKRFVLEQIAARRGISIAEAQQWMDEGLKKAIEWADKESPNGWDPYGDEPGK